MRNCANCKITKLRILFDIDFGLCCKKNANTSPDSNKTTNKNKTDRMYPSYVDDSMINRWTTDPRYMDGTAQFTRDQSFVRTDPSFNSGSGTSSGAGRGSSSWGSSGGGFGGGSSGGGGGGGGSW